jgi:hypothetical protein
VGKRKSQFFKEVDRRNILRNYPGFDRVRAVRFQTGQKAGNCLKAKTAAGKGRGNRVSDPVVSPVFLEIDVTDKAAGFLAANGQLDPFFRGRRGQKNLTVFRLRTATKPLILHPVRVIAVCHKTG